MEREARRRAVVRSSWIDAAILWIAAFGAASMAGHAFPAFADRAAGIDYLTAPFAFERILDWGERPDWSPDGTRLAFTESDDRDSHAYEIELATRTVRCLTCRWGANGVVTRIYYLPDGNFLILGPRSLSTSQAPRVGAGATSQSETALYWLPGSLAMPPQSLEAPAWGEIAISRTPTEGGGTRIAWGTHREGRPQLVMAELVHAGGRAALADRRVVYELDPSARAGGKATFAEAYNFSRDGRAITFWTIETPALNGEMYEVEIASGALRNLSRDPAHDETHLFPGEAFGLEESNRASDPDGSLRGISSLPAEAIVGLGSALGVKVPDRAELAGYQPHGELRGVGRPFDLYVVSLQGERRLRRLTDLSSSGVNVHQSIPAPDGLRIAFAMQTPKTGAHAGGAGRDGLYIGRFDAPQ